MVDFTPAKAAQLEQAKALVEAIQNGDDEQVNRLIQELGKVQESVLFQEICKLTRQLHDALTTFYLDERLARFTQNDIPDAKERLNYVITMTEQAANTTLNAVEYLLPVIQGMNNETTVLKEDWQRFRAREMSVDEFRELNQKIVQHFEDSGVRLQQIQERLTQVLMAQDFQDLTGQIIRRVITLVKDLETSMVDMIRLSNTPSQRHRDASVEHSSQGHGPAVPGLDTDTVSNQDDVDSLLSSLGF
jgi:chemotaxis protein CheZ